MKRIRRMNQATSVGREIQKQYTIAPHGGTVDIPKFTDTLHTAILFGMIEPAGRIETSVSAGIYASPSGIPSFKPL